jgi:hypothetical protein
MFNNFLNGLAIRIFWFIIFVIFCMIFRPFSVSANEIHENCLAKYNYKGLQEVNAWGNIATCIDKANNQIRFAEEDRIWEFVKANPHYRYSGIALPGGQQKPFYGFATSKSYKVQ